MSQFDKDSHDYPVYYYSHTLQPAEKNWTVTERECLAVIEAVKYFRVYVHGVKFTVVTDHLSLKWLWTLREPEGCLARWAIALQSFNYKIVH